MNLTSSVSDKGLTTIPKKIREKLNIKKGDKIQWILTESDRSELFIIRNPLKFLTGRHSQEEITYDNLEHAADKLVLDEVKTNSSN